MMAKGGYIAIDVKVNLPLWSAIKLRIAGLPSPYDKAESSEDKAEGKEEVNGIRILFKNGFDRDKEEEVAEADIKKAAQMEDEVAEQLEKQNEAGLAPEKTQEVVGTIRINNRTGKVEISSRYLSKVGICKIWVDYDTNLLGNTFGMCPRCYSSYSLLDFKRMRISEYENNSHI